jgi:hypothetical protein
MSYQALGKQNQADYGISSFCKDKAQGGTGDATDSELVSLFALINERGYI